jgi:hypothetical protein
MGLRVVHIINGECEILLHKTRDDQVQLRISETASDNSDSEPADFEIEGSIPALQSLFSTLDVIMSHADALGDEVN